MREVYLVDGSAYIYRAYHAIRPLSNSSGLPTHAVYGFTTILRRILREKKPECLAVAWDTRGPVFRHRLYPEYKANRPPMPDDLVPQIPYIHKIVDAYNILSMEHEDKEADDLIAAAVRCLTGDNCRVVIVSGDKDLLQLVSKNVSLWDPMNDKLMDEEKVEEKYGVRPVQLLDYLALTGDSADNIPGVPGIGPKTAQKLIAAYGTLEGLYVAIDELKASKMKERLIAHRDDAFLSRDLVRLCDTVDVACDPKDYVVREPDNEKLRSLLTELEFSSLMAADTSGQKVATEGFSLVRTAGELDRMMHALDEGDYLVVDTETDSLDARRATLVGISLCVRRQKAWYIPLAHCDAEGDRIGGQLERDDVLAALRPLLEDQSLPKIGHNLKYDWTIFANPKNGGTRLQGPLYDTMVGAWLIEPGRRSYKLDDLCREINIEMTSFAQVTGGGKGDGVFCTVPLEEAKNYSCEDVFGALSLFLHQQPKLKDLGLWKLFAEVEGPLIPVLARMERTGILVDQQVLAELADEFHGRLKELEAQIYQCAGRSFNINSPKQLAEILFDELGLPKGRKTKSGYSTDVKVLERLSAKHELPDLILQYRNLAKLTSTYIEKLARLAKKDKGRIHSSFNQCGTATGRLSSSKPNLQNIPIRTPEGRRIRQAFVAPSGSLLLSGDYSQIDLRVLAHFSRDKALVEAFQTGVDIHRKTAAEIFHVAPQLVTKEMRRVAKTINFGIVYGMSSFGLATQLKVSRKEAQSFIDQYFTVYSGVKTYMETIVSRAEKDGYVTTLLGRRRALPDIHSRNRTRREFARRTAINTPVQGTAADIIKLAMLEVDRVLAAQNLQGRMILQIHDELVLEIPEEELEKSSSLLKKAMENVMELIVPLVVNLQVGQNLGMQNE
ncbi:MAG TPA: DNA polymerase I [Desulfobulbus sp.]|nr:DNA polymerase I [Desulfobulbus sp.]